MLSAIVFSGCATDDACRDPGSLDLRVTDRQSDCVPDLDVAPGAMTCEQIAGDVDHDACVFRGLARCTGEVEARVFYTLAASGKPVAARYARVETDSA